MKEKFATAKMLPNGDISVTIPRKTDLHKMWENSGLDNFCNFLPRLIKNPTWDKPCHNPSEIIRWDRPCKNPSINLHTDDQTGVMFTQCLQMGFNYADEIEIEWHYPSNNGMKMIRKLGENLSVVFEKQPIKIYPYVC